MSDSPHQMLLRHCAAWAAEKGRPFDPELTERLLTLRDTYDELEPTWWPEGSVEHLLVVRWPAKGEVEPPPADDVVASLETYFRFLRNTGRMAARSAEPAALVKEARRAAPRMAEAAGDRTQWSPTKVMLEHGKTLGLTLDGAEDVAELQARMHQIVDAWNSLPDDERRRLMPGPDPAALVEEEPDAVVELLLGFADRLPTGELPGVEVVGPQFAASSYLQQALALARWVGDGRQVTDTEVLRLAPSREAYAALGLEARTRARLQGFDWDPAVIERELARPWRSAADCDALDRLWTAALTCGLVTLAGRKVVARIPGTEPDDEQWVQWGLAAGFGLLDRLEWTKPLIHLLVVQALMTSYVGGSSLVGWDELTAFHTHQLFGDRPERVSLPMDLLRRWTRHGVEEIDDTGLAVIDAAGVRLTEAGDVFVTWWLRQQERR